MAAAKLDGSRPYQRLLAANEGQGYFGGLPTAPSSVADVRSVILRGGLILQRTLLSPKVAQWEILGQRHLVNLTGNSLPIMVL